jgi:hypothetical protein
VYHMRPDSSKEVPIVYASTNSDESERWSSTSWNENSFVTGDDQGRLHLIDIRFADSAQSWSAHSRGVTSVDWASIPSSSPQVCEKILSR